MVRLRIRRWFRRTGKRREEVWSEPVLPPFIKRNPDAGPAKGGQGFQPGDITMGRIAREFLKDCEDDEPPGPHPGGHEPGG